MNCYPRLTVQCVKIRAHPTVEEATNPLQLKGGLMEMTSGLSDDSRMALEVGQQE